MTTLLDIATNEIAVVHFLDLLEFERQLHREHKMVLKDISLANGFHRLLIVNDTRHEK